MRFFIPTLAAAITILSVVSAIPAPPSPGTDNPALQDGVAKPDAAPDTAAQVVQGFSPEEITALKQMLASIFPHLSPNGGTTNPKSAPELNAPGAPPTGDSSM